MNHVLVIVLLAVSVISILLLLFRFLRNYFKFGFIGNLYIYILSAYLLCLLFSLTLNFTPQDSTSIVLIDGIEHSVYHPSSGQNGFVTFVSSLFDALKMMAVAFDRGTINGFINSKDAFDQIFGYTYTAVSFFALISTSISAILFFFKSFKAKLLTTLKRINPNNEIFYIFSDSRVTQILKLAEELKKEGKIVILLVSRSSLKTQEGTEYRDALIGKGFDVRAENVTQKLCRMIFSKYFNRQFKKFLFFKHPYRNRKVTVYGLFSSDELSMELATCFLKAINNDSNEANKKLGNHYFEAIYKNYKNFSYDSNYDKKKLSDEISKLSNFRVFVNYQETDFDLSNNFSGRTLHIINTLSQYDMISSEFLINNQLSDFLDKSKLSNLDIGELNVSFIGFGKVNKPIFEKMTYAYQLWDDHKHLVNYHIVDQSSESLIKKYSNEYTNKVSQKGSDYLEKPTLYNIDAECDGEDLSSYEALQSFVERAYSSKLRFTEDGLEMFIVSLADTNTDISIALSLREAILRTVDPKRQKNVVIFIRIDSEVVYNNFIEENRNFALSQEELNKLGPNSTKKPVAIVPFGQNLLMSRYIDEHHNTLMNIGLHSNKSYCGIRDEDLAKAQILFRKMRKVDVMLNIATAYSLGTKISILGGKANVKSELSDERINECNELYPKTDDKNLFKLCMLEHNRWSATSYLICKYGQMSISEHLASYNPESHEFSTKTSDKMKHICMTTNEGLKDLYKKEVEAHGSKEDIDYAKKLAFLNDVLALKEIINCLPENNVMNK